MRKMKTSTFSFMIVLLFLAVNVSAQKALPASLDDNATIVVTEQKQINGKTVVVETTKTAGEIRAQQQTQLKRNDLTRKKSQLKHAREFLQSTEDLDQVVLQTEKYQTAIATAKKRVQQLERELSTQH